MNDLDEYRLRWRGREAGPFPLAEINRQLDDHEIGLSHEIFAEDQWVTLEEFFAPVPAPAPTPEIQFEPSPAAPSPAPTFLRLATPADRVEVKKPKRRLIFALLAIVAGFIGLHNFYGRQWLTGILQLMLSVATFLLGFGILAAWIWAVIEAIVVHKDGEGIEMI